MAANVVGLNRMADAVQEGRKYGFSGVQVVGDRVFLVEQFSMETGDALDVVRVSYDVDARDLVIFVTGAHRLGMDSYNGYVQDRLAFATWEAFVRDAIARRDAEFAEAFAE